MNATLAATPTANMIKAEIEKNLPGAEVIVYSVGCDALVEVVHASFSDSDRTTDQSHVLDILNTFTKDRSVYIQELLTYKTSHARFNSLAHLRAVGFGHKNGISTLTADDAYVFLADLDAAYLTYAWLYGGESPFFCRAIVANEGVYASFPMREGVNYREIEMQGQHHLVKVVAKKNAEVWEIGVNVGYLGDGYA